MGAGYGACGFGGCSGGKNRAPGGCGSGVASVIICKGGDVNGGVRRGVGGREGRHDGGEFMDHLLLDLEKEECKLKISYFNLSNDKIRNIY